MKILPPNNPAPKPDKDTKKGLKGDGFAYKGRLIEFVLNDRTYACAFIIGAILLFLFVVGHAVVIFTGIEISTELSNALDNLWSAFLLCLGVMLGGKMTAGDKDD